MTNTDVIANIQRNLNQNTLDNETRLALLIDLTDALQWECERLRADDGDDEKRIASLVYEWESATAQCAELRKTEAALRQEMEAERQRAERELIDTRLTLTAEIVALKSKLYNLMLGALEPERKYPSFTVLAGGKIA